MKKTKFLMALACFGLLITGCGPTNTSESSKPTSSSGGATTTSTSSSSSSSSTSSVDPDPEAYYSAPFEAGFETATKWTKGHEYKFTFSVPKHYTKVVFAFGAQMSSSSHGSRSLYTNHDGASQDDPFESNEANDGTCRILLKVNGVEQEVTHDTYEEAGLTNSEVNYFRVAEFAVNSGDVEVSMTTHAQTGYRLLIGEEARLYYKASDESATPVVPVGPVFEGYKINFVTANCKVYVYDTKDYTKTPVETNSCVAKDEEGNIVAYDPRDEELQPQVNFRVVCDEGYTLNATNFTITGKFNKLKQGPSTADGLPDEEYFRITKVQEDLTVTIAPVQGEQAKGIKVSFVPTHCEIKVYVGPKNADGTNLDTAEDGVYYARSKDAPYDISFTTPQMNFEVVCDDNYEFKPTITDDKVDFITFTQAEGKDGYNKFKKNSDGTFNITKIDSDLTITITATEVQDVPPVDGTQVTKNIVDISGTTEDGTQVASLTLDSVITVSVNADGNNGKVYDSGKEWRLYQANSAVVTIAAADGYNIKSVTFTYSNKNGGVLKYGETTVASETAQAINPAAASVALSVGNSGTATNGQVRVSAITVVYDAIVA